MFPGFHLEIETGESRGFVDDDVVVISYDFLEDVADEVSIFERFCEKNEVINPCVHVKFDRWKILLFSSDFR